LLSVARRDGVRSSRALFRASQPLRAGLHCAPSDARIVCAKRGQTGRSTSGEHRTRSRFERGKRYAATAIARMLAS
jgi:hypothetical protein